MKTLTKCPSCGSVSDVPFTTCPGCGLIVEKYLKKQAEKTQREWEREAEKTVEAEKKRLYDEKKAAEIAQREAAKQAVKDRKKPCRYCKMEIPFEAKICPYCRKKLTTSFVTAAIAVMFGFLFLVAFVIPAIMPKSASTNTQTPPTVQQITSSANEEKAMEMVKRCPVTIDGSQTDIISYFAVLMQMLKGGGTFVEFDGWEAVAAGNNTYNVYVHYRCNSKKIDAHWEVDINTKAVRAKNQEAFILNGRRDVIFNGG